MYALLTISSASNCQVQTLKNVTKTGYIDSGLLIPREFVKYISFIEIETNVSYDHFI